MLIVWIADEQINITSPFMVIGPGTEQKNLRHLLQNDDRQQF